MTIYEQINSNLTELATGFKNFATSSKELSAAKETILSNEQVVKGLQDANQGLSSEVAHLKTINSDLQKQAEESKLKIEALEKSQADFEKKVAANASKLVATTMGTEPLAITPESGAEGSNTKNAFEELNAISNPAEKRAFYLKNKDAIIKAGMPKKK